MGKRPLLFLQIFTSPTPFSHPIRYTADERWKKENYKGFPRIDYALNARRLRKAKMEAASKVNKKVVREGDPETWEVLDVMCPTHNFTLDDFFMVMSAPVDDPRRKGREFGAGKKLGEDTFVAPLLEDPELLALRILGVLVFAPLQLRK